MHRDMLIRDY
ncbi:cytochrome D ubiquinol oxidase subunit I [Novimethylophilus kurashikiensis]|uniref:Cytochrome D ubiquinol oxidase subunit I n=1 Tax=Novimethylophilus kurashikiensis TaxID=1825523 RepID=A0A2R5F8W8_9PROT|nr:cytochrome D ubiquinol oxidase subunit I [Novimethylophilus kurashikiensis]